MLRALYLIDGLACGGKERQLVELATGLLRTGLLKREQIAVVSMGTPSHFDSALEEAGIRLARIVRRRRWDPLLAPV